MTAVLFVHYGDQWIRGSEQVLLDLLSRRHRAGIDPLLWTNVAPLAAAVTAMGLPANLDPLHFYGDYGAPRFSPAAYGAQVRRGLELVRRHDAAIIHCNSAAPTQWCLPVAWRTRRPLLTHLHAPMLRRGRLASLTALADRIVGVSAATLAGYRSDGVEAARLRVIYNGIARERLTEGRPHDLRARLGLAADSVIVAVVGSLIRRKGQDLLLTALAGLGERLPRLQTVLIGDGPDGDTLRRQAAALPRVHFVGEQRDVGAWLRGGADILLLPSRQEAAPLVLAEAALFGLPVIATRVGGVAEMVEDGVSGLLVQPESPEQIAAALIRLTEDPGLRRRLGDSAGRLFSERFDADHMAAHFAALYAEMIAAGPGGPAALPGRLWRSRGVLWPQPSA